MEFKNLSNVASIWSPYLFYWLLFNYFESQTIWQKIAICAKDCNRPHHSNVVLASFVGQNDSLVKYYVKLIASIMSFYYLPTTCKIKLW